MSYLLMVVQSFLFVKVRKFSFWKKGRIRIIYSKYVNFRSLTLAVAKVRSRSSACRHQRLFILYNTIRANF